MTDRLNWNLIESCVKKIQVDCGIEKEERAFLSFIASEIIGISIEDAHDSITDGALDRGVDLFFYDQYSHTLYLLNTKYTKRFENSEKRFPFSEVDKIKSFISDFIDQNLRKNANVSEDLFERCSYVWQTYTHSEFSIQVYFCSNMLDFDHVKILSMKNEIEKDYVYAYSLCGERIVHDYIRRRKSSINSTIKFYGKQYFERSDGYYRGLIATVRAIDFVNILRDPNDALLINDAIFEDNIRKYLGKKNAVNSSIYETATGDRGVDFWYLNNGITMVCQRFSFNSGIPDPEVELSDIQIVNGGQTSNALFEVFKNDPGKLENIYLIVRICETQNEEIKLKIAEATNNQNKILGRDLRSNDDVQKKIEYLLKNNGITYL
ncbi:MAG: AIPR family protein, partial [Rhodobacterales bacterium]|nr:AIPR family protein [Rhodobacterales bacterium]